MAPALCTSSVPALTARLVQWRLVSPLRGLPSTALTRYDSVAQTREDLSDRLLSLDTLDAGPDVPVDRILIMVM